MSTSDLYSPDQEAVLQDPWVTAFRMRHMTIPLVNFETYLIVDGLRVPINYHNDPIVSLEAACFANGTYQYSAFQKCFSNLLAAAWRRFIVDVYWDAGRSVWSLCPVEVPAQQSNSRKRDSVTISGSETLFNLFGRGISDILDFPEPANLDIAARQAASSPTNIAATAASTTLSESSAPSASSSASGQNEASGQASGCPPNLSLDLVTGLLKDFINQSDGTTNASLCQLIFNVHVAESSSSSNGSAQEPSQLPTEGSYISDIINGNLSSKLYSAKRLEDERSNLNDSWFDVDPTVQPEKGYYEEYAAADGTIATSNGWPTEAYMEFKKFFRVTAGFGQIDPEMANYNIESDLEYLFGPGELLDVEGTASNGAGGAAQDCFFSASDTSITSTNNNSWAATTVPTLNLPNGIAIDTTIPAITNLISCGVAPLLNTALSNTTADQDISPFLATAANGLWSWAPNQPTNLTDTDDSDVRNKCAVMPSTGDHPGRWTTADCNTKYRLACRDTNSPYIWQISRKTTTYANADHGICPDNLTFSIPHTALENAHLLAALQAANPAHPSSSPTSPDAAVLIDINSLSVPNCWTTGVNGTCPYQPRQDTDQTRVVVVPTVAVVIIGVLAALTFLIKCASNRRESHRGRRRRVVDGWAYEGVPS